MTKIVGITGGIGSGKTTFSNHLKKLGFLVHESDMVVSEIYNKPKKQFLSFIKEKISQDATDHYKINKAEIANVIFSNNTVKKILERRYFFYESLSRTLNFLVNASFKQSFNCVVVKNYICYFCFINFIMIYGIL